MDAGYAIAWRDGLADVRLSCGKANALNARSLAAIEAALEEAERGQARGIVLAGYDGFFSAGLDLVGLYELDPAGMDAVMRAFDRAMLRVFAFPRPVVAAVNGHAVAGGCILGLACDARVGVGRGELRVGLNEVRLGVPFPASALEIARYALPARVLEEVLYGGELYDPTGAVARGLLDRVVAGDVAAAARDLCARLAGQPAGAFAAVKAGVKGPAFDRARATLDDLRRAFVDAWFSPEARERIGAVRARLSA